MYLCCGKVPFCLLPLLGARAVVPYFVVAPVPVLLSFMQWCNLACALYSYSAWSLAVVISRAASLCALSASPSASGMVEHSGAEAGRQTRAVLLLSLPYRGLSLIANYSSFHKLRAAGPKYTRRTEAVPPDKRGYANVLPKSQRPLLLFFSQPRKMSRRVIP